MTVVNLLNRARFCFGRKRDRVLNAFEQLAALPQQKEEQVEHDEQAEDEIGRALANAERLRGNELAASLQRVGKPVLNGAETR